MIENGSDGSPGVAPVTLTLNFAEMPSGKLPYPYHVLPDGQIGRQDVWKGDPARLAGFQRDLGVNNLFINTVDLALADFLADPDQAVGMYPVFIDADGDMGTYTLPVDSVSGTGR